MFLLMPLIIRHASLIEGRGRGRDLHHTHSTPIPRLGGLALAGAYVLLHLVLLSSSAPSEFVVDPTVALLSSLSMFALGFWDDVRALGAKKKLVGQIIIASAVWFSGVGIQQFSLPGDESLVLPRVWSAVFTVAWLVGMTNLINIIDGVDGVAGGICFMLMLLTTYVGRGHFYLCVISAGMAGALLAFLRYNFPPARVYLGDGGAYFLGFLIGLFSLANSQKGTIAAALIAPLFVLALPIVDTGIAILRRGLRGLPIFRPDKRHIHHRLLLSGLSRREVVLSIYTLTAVFMALGLVAFWSSAKLIPVLIGVAMLILLIVAGNVKFSREWFAVGRVVGNSIEMRQEIRYALAMVRWLELEGQRCRSVGELSECLLFCARRLGFTSALIKAQGEEFAMGAPTHSQECHTITVELTCPIPAQLTLVAPRRAPDAENLRFVPTVNDENVFEILSELLAEGWMRAARRSSIPLRPEAAAPAIRAGHATSSSAAQAEPSPAPRQ